jgi:hypothetical protein
MKRVVYYSLLCLALASCQKDVEPLATGSGSNTGGSGSTGGAGNTGSGGTTAAGTLTATIDGKTVNFSTASQAIRTGVAGSFAVAVFGFQGTPGASDQISLSVIGNAPITTGTYIENDLTGERLASVGLVKTGVTLPFSSLVSPSNPGKVVITAISQTSVEGSFSGDVFQMDNQGNTVAKKVITQGKFNVRFN